MSQMINPQYSSGMQQAAAIKLTTTKFMLRDSKLKEGKALIFHKLLP